MTIPSFREFCKMHESTHGDEIDAVIALMRIYHGTYDAAGIIDLINDAGTMQNQVGVRDSLWDEDEGDIEDEGYDPETQWLLTNYTWGELKRAHLTVDKIKKRIKEKEGKSVEGALFMDNTQQAGKGKMRDELRKLNLKINDETKSVLEFSGKIKDTQELDKIIKSLDNGSYYITAVNEAHHLYEAGGNNRTNNVIKVHNLLGMSRSMFIDATAGGYKVSLGTNDLTKVKAIVNNIKESLGIDVIAKPKGGHGPHKGIYYIIIPYYNGDEAPLKYIHK